MGQKRGFVAVAGLFLLLVCVWAVVAVRPVPEASAGEEEDPGPSSVAFGKVAVSRPSQALTGALEAVAAGRQEELGDYFVDKTAAISFYRHLAGRVPGGATLVAQADQVDAGAEAGNLVPVTVWVTGSQEAAGLRGEASFVVEPPGVRIREVRLNALPLKVKTWTSAADRVGAAGVRRAAVPFYGRYRFEVGAKRFAVDALTGSVEEE